MKILIAGAGAMGANFGHLLSREHEVTLCDSWQANIDAINQRGLKIHRKDLSVQDGQVTVETSHLKAYLPEETPNLGYDLIFLFTKAHFLDAMLAKIAHLVKDHTLVTCCLNGLGHQQTMQKYIPKKNLVMGVTLVGAGAVGPGEFELMTRGLTEVQEVDAGEFAAGELVAQTLDKAELPARHSDHLAFSIWRKAVLNGVVNPLCALLNANMGQLSQMPDAQNIVKQIVHEYALAAAYEGVTLDEVEVFNHVWHFCTPDFAGHRHFPSMHQDLNINHRKTEIEFINGYVAKVLKAHGHPAPYCELIANFIHLKEVTSGIV